MKGVQCYELFVGIALKNHAFSFSLVVANIDNKKIMKAVKKTCAEREVSLLKDVKIRKQFEGKAMKLIDVGATNMWGHFKDGGIKACDEEKYRRYLMVK